MSERHEIFWVVWNPDHGLPRHRHMNRSLAETEARRLALANNGSEFIVLQAVCSMVVRDPVECVTFDEIPF